MYDLLITKRSYCRNPNNLFLEGVDTTNEDIRSFLEWSRADIGSTRKIAQQIGVHPNYVGMVLRGQRNLSTKAAAKLAALYDLSLADLIRKGNEIRNKGISQEEEAPPDHQKSQGLIVTDIQNLPPNIHWPIATLSRTEIEDCLQKARFVLESKLILYANALLVNVESFYRSLTVEGDRAGALQERGSPALWVKSGEILSDPSEAVPPSPAFQKPAAK